MKVLIDYLTMTSKIHNERQFIDMLGAQECSFLEMPGRYGWQNRLYYRGISVLFGGSREDVCLELSGTGCRTVEEISGNSFDWFRFLQGFEFDFRVGDMNISRLDIAGDDHDGILKYRQMSRQCRQRRYICKARWNMWTDGAEQAIYFGSPASDRRLRIYNKAMEQELEGEHWIRVEMQMRNKNALSFLLNLFREKDVGACYAGVLRDFLRFTTSAPQNNNHSRCETCPWWDKFIGQLGKCPQLYVDGGVYTLWHVQRFLERQASSSLKLWLEANNGDWEDIVSMIEGAKLNSRQKQLLDKIKGEGSKD